MEGGIRGGREGGTTKGPREGERSMRNDERGRERSVNEAVEEREREGKGRKEKTASLRSHCYHNRPRLGPLFVIQFSRWIFTADNGRNAL